MELGQLVESGIEADLFPAAAWGVYTQDGEALAEGAAGLAQPEAGTAARTETIWDLASLTKPVATATSTLILAQEGALHLGEEVRRFLPETSPSLDSVTPEHLLTHTSGLKPWEKLHSQSLSREEILARVYASERATLIGEGYAYSDLGYILLGEVVQRVSGQALSDFALERVFTPLGMDETRYLPPPEWRPRIAATHCPDRNRVLVGEVHDGNCDAVGGVAGHAGLFGTLSDLRVYGEMLLREGERDGVRVLCPPAARQMMRNQNRPGLNAHTLGWFAYPSGYLPKGDFLPEDTFGHTGFTGTSLLLSPSLGLISILLTNRVYHDRPAGDFLAFRRRFHNAAANLL